MTERFSEPIISALSMELGHEPPFRRREISKVQGVVICNAAELRGLTRLSGLHVLLIRGYGPTDLAPLRGLTKLGSITIEYGALAEPPGDTGTWMWARRSFRLRRGGWKWLSYSHKQPSPGILWLYDSLHEGPSIDIKAIE